MSSLRENDGAGRGSLSPPPAPEFSAREIADCVARHGLLSMVIERSPVLPSPPRDEIRALSGPEIAVLSPAQVRDVVRQAHELGARRIMLLSVPGCDTQESEITAFARDLGMQSEVVLHRADTSDDGCELKNAPTGQGCMRHLYSCVVSLRGWVYPCIGVPVPLGNVHAESLRDILRHSEVMENLANYRELIKGPCRECPEANQCYGCRGAAFVETGDYLAADPTCPRVEGVPMECLPVDAAPLIPHGETIRMVDCLTRIGEREAWGEFVVPQACPFVDKGGRLDATAYIELIVQTFAACHEFHVSGGGQATHRGLLLGVNNLQISCDSCVGDSLIIHVRKTARLGAFGVVEGIVYHRDGREVARGEAKVWQGEGDSGGVFG